MEQQPSYAKLIMPLFFVFVVVNSILLYWQPQLQFRKIDPLVVFVGNCLLFFISMLSIALHVKASTNANPNVGIRTVLIIFIIKFFVISGTILGYLFVSGTHRSIPAIFICLGLYVIYAVIEARLATTINKNQRGKD